MSMSCTLYKNTGLNAVNVADDPTKLEVWGDVVKTSALDAIQNRFLTSIQVRAQWSSIREVDYAKVDDFFYFVTGVTMTSFDVASLALVPDFLTTAGGPASLEFLDGVTERHHVAKSDDVFGAFDEPDPFLSPAQVLRISLDDMKFSDDGGYYYLVESSIDLWAMGVASSHSARTFSDPSGQAEVTTPATIPVTRTTAFYMSGTGTPVTFTNGTCLFDVNNVAVHNGIQVVRDISSENAIIAQYAVPQSMFTVSITSGYVDSVIGVSNSSPLSSAFNFEYATVRNMRVLYGENNKYGLISASGNSSEFTPEEIFNNADKPSIIMKADGRHDGKPYFSYDYFHGTKTTASNVNFFTNAVGGMEWRNLPLTYVTKSGSVQDAYRLESQRRSEVSSNEFRTNQSAISMIGGAMQMAGGVTPASIIGGATTMAQAEQTYLQNQDQYRIATERELRDFAVSQYVITPTIMFPFQSPSIRDYVGNGVVPYRYYLSQTDRNRIDKILTAFGYRHTELLNQSHFTNRPHFNYVKAVGVSIGGNLPQWWKSGISEQLSNGVRVWHVKPSASYYTRNE